MAEVKNLQELLAQYVGPNKVLVSSEVDRLTAPGENYLSLVVKVDAVLKDENTGEEKTVHGVGKCIHTGNVNDMLKNFGKINYKNELTWYTTILPTLDAFVKDKGMKKNFDIFPKLIAFRANLHGTNDEVDSDSILLMENMITNGYNNIDRHVGFDLQGAKVVLQDLATFHAVPIAMKLKRRKAFEENVRKHLNFNFGPPKPKEGEEPKPPPGANDNEVWFQLLEEQSQCKLYVPRLRRIMQEYKENRAAGFERPKREPFATISHNDMWVNNTMQVIKNGKVDKNKLVDFQVYNYESPAQDLLFFIWSSVQVPVVRDHFGELIDWYYKNFLEVLTELGCGISPFNESKFEEELKASAAMQLFHALMMIRVIMAKKGSYAMDMSADPGQHQLKKEDITPAMLDKVACAVVICGKKGWI